MENELRYYLKLIKAEIQEHDFKPSYIVTSTKLPTEAIEIAVNNQNIAEKIEYILEAYDDEMCLKSNQNIRMVNLMVV